MKLEERIRMQGKILHKLSKATIKFNEKRVTVYRKGRYAGWVRRSDYASIRRATEGGMKTERTSKAGFWKVRMSPIALEKKVQIKTEKGTERRKVKIFTYTKSQRKFVVESFKKRQLPIDKAHPKAKITDLLKAFKNVSIGVSELLHPT